MTESPRRNPVLRVVDWLRAGYPAGVPQQDYIALLSVLRRRLTPEEIESIAAELSAAASPDTPISVQEIVLATRDQTNQHPGKGDVRRVQAHLAMGGWPLSTVDDGVAEDDATTD